MKRCAAMWLVGVLLILFMIWQTIRLENKPSPQPLFQAEDEGTATTADGEAAI